jgi:CRP-like cAMP-binding protein
LNEQGWLSRTMPDFRQAIVERLTIRKFASGDAIFRLGDAEGGLWAIVEGGVQFELSGPQLTPGLTHIAIPGFWFGESSLISRVTRRVGAYAAQPSVLATISLADCRAVLEEEPGHWQWIALLAKMNTDLVMGIAADLLLQEPRQRVIAALLRMSGWRSGLHLAPSPGPVHISQQQLGHVTNLSRTVVGGILRDLHDRGLISIRYRTLEVLDGKALKTSLGET